jgi:hypothetical protein
MDREGELIKYLTANWRKVEEGEDLNRDGCKM